MNRLNWAEYGLVIAQAVSTRSEDPWHKVGAVAFRSDNSVAGVGYNGPPSGINLNWADRAGRHPFIIHAEINALRWTTPQDIKDGWLASTREPCSKCLASIAAHGIKFVVYIDANSEVNGELAAYMGIHLQQMINPPIVKLGTWDDSE